MKYTMHSGYENQQQQQIMKERQRKKKPTEHRFPLQWIYWVHRAFPFHNVFRTILLQSIEHYYYYSCNLKPKPCNLSMRVCFVFCVLCVAFRSLQTRCVSITLFSILLMLHFTLKVLEIRNACGMRLNRVSSILKLVSQLSIHSSIDGNSSFLIFFYFYFFSYYILFAWMYCSELL